jgi:hypothetical protein
MRATPANQHKSTAAPDGATYAIILEPDAAILTAKRALATMFGLNAGMQSPYLIDDHRDLDVILNSKIARERRR